MMRQAMRGCRGLRTDVRALTKGLDRLEARVLDIKADEQDLEDRVVALEGKTDAG